MGLRQLNEKPVQIQPPLMEGHSECIYKVGVLSTAHDYVDWKRSVVVDDAVVANGNRDLEMFMARRYSLKRVNNPFDIRLRT